METVKEAEPGLSEAEAQARLRRFGSNEIPVEHTSLLSAVLRRLWGPIPWMLEVSLLLEALLGKVSEPIMIAAWLSFSAVVGAVQERRARSVLDLLRGRLQVCAWVRRDRSWQMRPARDLVPGDLIAMRPGDLVPADCVIEGGTVEVDQSALTGESAVVALGPARRSTRHRPSTAATPPRP